jgi:hypothetical protein
MTAQEVGVYHGLSKCCDMLTDEDSPYLVTTR